MRRARSSNTVAESFFATTKEELIYRHPWPTYAAARDAIANYIEMFHNPRRRHSGLGYSSRAPSSSGASSPWWFWQHKKTVPEFSSTPPLGCLQIVASFLRGVLMRPSLFVTEIDRCALELRARGHHATPRSALVRTTPPMLADLHPNPLPVRFGARIFPRITSPPPDLQWLLPARAPHRYSSPQSWWLPREWNPR